MSKDALFYTRRHLIKKSLILILEWLKWRRWCIIFTMYHARIYSLFFVFQRTIEDLYIKIYNLKRGSTLSSFQRNIYNKQVQCFSILRYGNNVNATMNSYIIILLTILEHNYNINDHYKVFWVHKIKICILWPNLTP